MPRTPPNSTYTTRGDITTDYTQRTPPVSEYERPRFLSSLALSDSSGELLTDSSLEILVATGDPVFTKIIQTAYT